MTLPLSNAPTFPYRMPPYEHQRVALRLAKLAPNDGTDFAWLLEPGLGKTMVAACNAAWLHMKGKTDGMLVIAPRGAHTNWVKDELPKHMPIPYTAFAWNSGKASTLQFSTAAHHFLRHPGGFAVLAVNVDALRLERARILIREFCESRRVVGIMDESADIASPSSARGRKARALSKLLAYRRILDGTPWAESIFELYGQFNFLNPDIIGVPNMAAMKRVYGEWVQIKLRNPVPGKGGRSRTHFPKFVGYKNLDRLARRIAPYSYRCTKAEAMPYLPQRSYTKWYFDLSDPARIAYDQLREEYLLELGNGYEVEAAQVLTRMLRLQQIAAGYVPARTWRVDSDGEQIVEPEYRIDPNARIGALLAAMQHYRGPSIVWCRFKYDQRLLYDALRTAGRTVAWYQGSDDERDRMRTAFQDGRADVFLADPTSGGRSLTLTRAEYMFFYTHYYGLRKRIQSEDRFHRIGLDHNVLVVDLVAQDTVDEKIVKSHQDKQELSSQMGTMVSAEQWL